LYTLASYESKGFISEEDKILARTTYFSIVLALGFPIS